MFSESAFGGPTDSIPSLSWKRPRFLFQIDRYLSFVSKSGADIFGFRTGLEFQKKYRFGMGLYDLKSDIIVMLPLNEEDAANAPNDTVKAKLNMTIIPFFFEYVFYDKDPWQCSASVSMGFGETYFNYFDKNGKNKRLSDAPILDYEVGINGQYKILKWFGVGAGLGYRLMLIDNPKNDYNFNAPFYNVKLKLFVGEIFRSIFPNKKLQLKN